MWTWQYEAKPNLWSEQIYNCQPSSIVVDLTSLSSRGRTCRSSRFVGMVRRNKFQSYFKNNVRWFRLWYDAKRGHRFAARGARMAKFSRGRALGVLGQPTSEEGVLARITRSASGEVLERDWEAWRVLDSQWARKRLWREWLSPPQGGREAWRVWEPPRSEDGVWPGRRRPFRRRKFSPIICTPQIFSGLTFSTFNYSTFDASIRWPVVYVIIVESECWSSV